MGKTKGNDAGVYGIATAHNGKLYVGQTNHLPRRMREHLSELKSQRHSNMHMQNVYNKHSEKAFEFRIIERFSDSGLPATEEKNWLNVREKHWIAFYGTTEKEKGYNMTSGGDSFQFNDEIRRRMSKSRMGKKNPNFGTEKYRGSGNGNSIYDEQQVLKAISLLKDGVIVREVASQTGISERSVRAIKTGNSWVHLTGGAIGAKAAKGEASGSSKLNSEQVLEILQYIRAGVPFKDIAPKFGVSDKTVGGIARGELWTHLIKPSENPTPVKKRNPSTTLLNESQVVEIVALIKQTSLNFREIGEKFNVKEHVISAINSGKAWKEVTGGERIRVYGNTGIAPANKERCLSKEGVIKIIEMIRSGIFLKDIAANFGVSTTSISKIAAGKAWVEITGGPVFPDAPSIPEDTIREIIYLLCNTETRIEAIADVCKVSVFLVRSINNGERFTDISGGRIREKGPRKGSANGKASISEEQARAIVSDLLKQTDIMDIAENHNVKKRIVLDIKNKKHWKHLTENLVFTY